jgi:hypothetical protein
MPPRDNPNLREMRALLGEIKAMMNDDDVCAPDHQDGMFNDWSERAKKAAGSLYTKASGKEFKTSQEKLEAFFNASTEQRTLLTDFLNGTKNVKDVFNTLKVLISADELMEIVHPGTPSSTIPGNVKVTNATNMYRAMTDTNKQKQMLIQILSKLQDHDAFNALKVVMSYRDEMLVIWKDKMKV